MENKNKLNQIKIDLCRLAGKKKSRTSKWSRDCPTEWQPTKVTDPRTNLPFTPDGAWDFIVEILSQDETELEEKILDIPKGKKGYVFRIETKSDDIYIKLQFGNGGKIIGRSFHQ